MLATVDVMYIDVTVDTDTSINLSFDIHVYILSSICDFAGSNLFSP